VSFVSQPTLSTVAGVFLRKVTFKRQLIVIDKQGKRQPMTDSSASGDVPVSGSSTSAKGGKKKDDLDERQEPTLSAWQLRERMKHQNPPTYRPKAVSMTPMRTNGALDPSLPPAFRAAAVRQRKKEVDDFMSLDSVHSSKTQKSMLTAKEDSDSDFDGSDSFGDEDSFASLGEDDDDDEAYREGRNQMARQTIECSQSQSTTRPKTNLRLKKGGVIGTPLDFIAE
jgi:hypothetical protein